LDTFIAFAFEFINIAIMPLWFGLLFFPRKAWVSLAIDTFVFVAAILYVVNMVPGLAVAFPIILKPTIPTVGALLSTPAGTLLSWTHFVIGDLWAGRWISQDAHRHGISRLWVVPILILTLLFGPIGFLSYFLVKLALTKTFGTKEKTPELPRAF